MFTASLALLTIVMGYLTGSLCSAVVICRLFALPDPRLEGSKNPGATNVLRLAGKKYAILVLLADVLKGVLPVLGAKLLGVSDVVVGYTCLAAVLGHVYPLFFEFKGGKGVATALGVLLAFHYIPGLFVVLTWLVVAILSRYSSLASLISISCAPIYFFIATDQPATCVPLILIALLIIYKHRSNISRLRHGQEPHINVSQKHKKKCDA